MANFNTVQRENYQVCGDTECHRQGDGYERTLVLVDWDPIEPRRMARVQIRVDRRREFSFAHAHVWIPTSGWQYITSAPQEEWWDDVPGYTRGPTETAHNKTMDIVDDLVARLVEIGI